MARQHCSDKLTCKIIGFSSDKGSPVDSQAPGILLGEIHTTVRAPKVLQWKFLKMIDK
jgi:hypothetical protein